MNNFFDYNNFVFAQPYFLLLLPILLLLFLINYLKGKKNNRIQQASFLISTTQYLPKQKLPILLKIKPFLTILNKLALLFLIVALARPQIKNSSETSSGSGIDILLSMDISGSMLAQDFTPNRLEASKDVAVNFVKGRPYDRMGLVIFSGESFSQCPLTTDHNVLLYQIQNLKCGMLEDGTAIGMGLATAIDRLKASDAKSKIVILLTDGVNNSGIIDPYTALEIAKTFKIKVYTIGVGTQGMAKMPIGKNAFDEWIFDNAPVEIDETLMQKIASETGGQYFRCVDNKALEKVYQQIDQLEKSKINIQAHTRYKEMYSGLVWVALIVLLMVFLLQQSLFRSVVD